MEPGCEQNALMLRFVGRSRPLRPLSEFNEAHFAAPGALAGDPMRSWRRCRSTSPSAEWRCVRVYLRVPLEARGCARRTICLCNYLPRAFQVAYLPFSRLLPASLDTAALTPLCIRDVEYEEAVWLLAPREVVQPRSAHYYARHWDLWPPHYSPAAANLAVVDPVLRHLHAR